jgi:type IV pilus assembly protein PilN
VIRVNLLSSHAAPQVGETLSPSIEGMSQSDIQRQTIVRILILIIIPAGLAIYEAQTIPKLKAMRSEINNSIAELQTFNEKADKAVKEIKKFQEDEQKLKKQIETVETLSKDRLREIQVLELVQQVIPERVWLKEIEFKGPKITMRGQAMSDSEITSFIEALSRSVFLNDVQPIATTEGILDGQRIRDFEISASLGKTKITTEGASE